MTTNTTMTVTITANNVYSPYGQRYTVGSQQTLDFNFGRDLVTSGRATDTYGVLANTNQTAFLNAPVVISTSAPDDVDGRPDGTIYFQVTS